MRLDDLCRILGPSFPLQRPSDSTAQAAETPDEVLIAVGEHEVQALERLIADGEAERVSVCLDQLPSELHELTRFIA